MKKKAIAAIAARTTNAITNSPMIWNSRTNRTASACDAPAIQVTWRAVSDFAFRPQKPVEQDQRNRNEHDRPAREIVQDRDEDPLDDCDPERDARPACAEPAAGLRRAVLEHVRRVRDHASTVPRRCRQPARADPLQRSLCGLCGGAVVEEPVHRGAGSGDVGVEGAEAAQLVASAASSRGRSAAVRRGRAGGGRRRARRAARRGARPSRRRRRARRSRRRRTRSRASARRFGTTSTIQKSCGRSSGSSVVPSPEPSCGPSTRKNGTSAPSVAASSCSSAGESGSGSVSFASRSAVAASELPPPRPAATGRRFSIRTVQRGRGAGARGERGEGVADERVRGEAGDGQRSAGSTWIRSASASRW